MHPQLFKQIVLFIALNAVFRAQALPTFEPFANAAAQGGSAYANGAPLFHQANASGESWAEWNGGTATYAVICTNAGLSYGNLPASFPVPLPTNGVYLPGQSDMAGGAAGLSAALVFSHAIIADPNNRVTTTVYASFLMKVTNLGDLAGGGGLPIYFAGFATNAGDQSATLPKSAMKIYLAGNATTAGQSTNYFVGLADNSGNASAVFDPCGHTSNDVLFVVADYEFGVSGKPDLARLWVNPPPSSFALPYPPVETGSIIITGGNRINRAADFFLLARGGQTLWGGLFMSNLRVGTTWNYATGGADSVQPLLSASNSIGRAVFNSVNGMPGATNILLSSTDLSLPMSSWTMVNTNLFDGHGGANFTNSLPGGPQRYYALQTAPPPAGNPALWIPACGAWLGAVCSNSTSWGSDTVAAYSAHEAHLGRQVDILREYWGAGAWTGLTTTEKNYINAGRKVLISFKPNSNWASVASVADGGSPTVNAQMTNIAVSVAAIKPKKLMICVWHEPQNDVNTTDKTTNDYVMMWRNIRHIFDGAGATNVIWVWNMQGDPNFVTPDIVNPLWPGNAYVDWVTWDKYKNVSSQDFVGLETNLYNFYITNSDSIHNYLSKPWGWAEWGIGQNTYYPTVAIQTNGINELNTAVNASLFPKIRYIAYYDNLAPAILDDAWGAYSNFANSPYMTQQCAH